MKRFLIHFSLPPPSHLRLSAEKDSEADTEDEVRFQQAIVDNCGEFANHLSDTQKVDILTFILGKIPTTVRPRSKSSLLRCLVSVAKTYKTSAIRNALPEALVSQLLAVLLFAAATRRGSGDRPDLHRAAVHFEQRLRRGAGDLEVPELDEVHVRRRVYRPQPAVDRERL